MNKWIVLFVVVGLLMAAVPVAARGVACDCPRGDVARSYGRWYSYTDGAASIVYSGQYAVDINSIGCNFLYPQVCYKLTNGQVITVPVAETSMHIVSSVAIKYVVAWTEGCPN